MKKILFFILYILISLFHAKTYATNGHCNTILTRYYFSDCYERDVDSLSNVTQRLYLGGSAYDATMMLEIDSAGSAISAPILSGGNSLYFGDPFMSASEYAYGVLGGALVGGTINGITASVNGKNFFTGADTKPIPQPEHPTGNLNNSTAKQSATQNSSTAQPQIDSDEALRASIVGDLHEKSNYTLYYGYDRDDPTLIRYVGITKRDPAIRFAEHLRSGTERANLDYKIIHKNLTYIDARIAEQQVINQLGFIHNNGQLYNKINSISPLRWKELGIINFKK